MNETPKKRWLRFRLSTVLILTAIVAWGMAVGPWTTLYSRVMWGPDMQSHPGTIIVDGEVRVVKGYEFNPAFGLAALALLAFLAWKVASPVVERRRRRSAAPE